MTRSFTGTYTEILSVRHVVKLHSVRAWLFCSYPEVDDGQGASVLWVDDVRQVLQVVGQEGPVLVTYAHGLSLGSAGLVCCSQRTDVTSERRVQSHQLELKEETEIV